ncbi:MAG TPA: FKBP-type peptidyl-prolyl cis-trans isomerase [Candidatus Limnocylindria bacterium]|nr:FKBP-type peptidyl-prolyl cis-trans isomerase [Candidatus Limnocylindria bacterium]
MQKPVITAVSLLTAGIMLLGNALAQQTPAAKTQQPPAAKAQAAPPAGAQKAPAAKTGPATKPRTQSVLTLKTQKDKLSYALGMNLGSNLHKEKVEVDPAIVLRGLKDALAAGKMLLTEDEARATLTQLQTEVRSKQQEKMKVAGEMNKKEGVEFLAANKSKEGVVILPSGLQYKILTEGTGPKPTASDTVVCNYRGTLISGAEFDSSYKRGQPASFPVNGVIKGWTEALQLMPAGSKWQLFVPAELGYGDRGAGADIGPGATLIFEVELLSIQGKDKPEGAPK